MPAGDDVADTLIQAPVQQAQEPRSPWSLGKEVKAALLATAATITGLLDIAAVSTANVVRLGHSARDFRAQTAHSVPP